MKEISLHIMDIVQNSVRADARNIGISLLADTASDALTVIISDDGSGMSEEMVAHVTDPFVTSRTTRRVGLGLSLLKAGAEGTGGSFSVRSKLGEGTIVQATYVMSNIDRPPIGDFAGTVHSIIICNPQLDFHIEVKLPDKETQTLDTKEVREVLGDISLDEPDISAWLRENMDELFPAEYSAF